MNKLLAVFAILAAVAGSAYALKCYSCTYSNLYSTGSDACADTFVQPAGTSEQQDCPSGYSCYRNRAETSISTTNVVSIVKGCTSSCKEEHTSNDFFGITSTSDINCCTTDLCNSAEVSKMSLLTAALSLALAVFWKY